MRNWTLNLLGSGSSNLIRIEIIDTAAISYMLRKIPAPVVVIRSSPASSSFVSDEKKMCFYYHLFTLLVAKIHKFTITKAKRIYSVKQLLN